MAASTIMKRGMREALQYYVFLSSENAREQSIFLLKQVDNKKIVFAVSQWGNQGDHGCFSPKAGGDSRFYLILTRTLQYILKNCPHQYKSCVMKLLK